MACGWSTSFAFETCTNGTLILLLHEKFQKKNEKNTKALRQAYAIDTVQPSVSHSKDKKGLI